jgi:diguanylate cyclase (GGDEF)-like protein
LRVGLKFFFAVSLLVIAMLAVAAVGVVGVYQSHLKADLLFNDNVQTLREVALVADSVHDIELATLELVAAVSDVQAERLSVEVDAILLPEARERIASARIVIDDTIGFQTLDAVESGLEKFSLLRQAGGYASVTTAQEKADLTDRTAALFEPLTAATHALLDEETRQAVEAKQQADHSYRATLLVLGLSAAFSMFAGVMIVLVLSRNIVPRIRRYSDFATDIAAGRPTTSLHLSGSDELADLGAALNAMVDQRAVRSISEERQAEYVDTLQVTSTEEEAHELIKRHLERSLSDSHVVVLQRNNSENRLEAATSTACDTELAGRLASAEPRSCLALRFARTHCEGEDVAPLLGCSLCADRGTRSLCEPLLVGGEVIGSVLVSHSNPRDVTEEGRIKTSVAQAAPVLANLRNLALAEFRANNDSLTGLPNKRATDDTLKRMVAQANRSFAPFSAIMLDLDHFKHINDQFGHGKGDEVLAAVGAALAGCLRASDFAGRFGGEEFLILLPDTHLDGAKLVAEKIRATIAAITVSGIEREITASLGIAQLIEHAGTANELVRAADRAMFSAKTGGRNRTVVMEDSPV